MATDGTRLLVTMQNPSHVVDEAGGWMHVWLIMDCDANILMRGLQVNRELAQLKDISVELAYDGLSLNVNL
eukprot:629772-Pyramimonas_sp.AAC.1